MMPTARDSFCVPSAEPPISMNEALSNMAKDDGTDVLKEGWALRSKRKSGHYSDKAKQFVEKKFNEGVKTGRKMDPAEAERLMKEDDTIRPFERMNAQQIRFFRRNN
ncbi:hypothetical protein PENTCL1PPCAC_15332, partial [Pristionchus entomophagus]